MAEKCVESLQPEIGRELCLVKGKNGKFLGYKMEILIENLSERENMMFVCIRCQGIMREVCTSSGGEQFCSCCKKEGEQSNPTLRMDSMVLSFKCSCPLSARGCGWLGALGGCLNHIDTCGYVYETCKLRCGVVLQRNELKVHERKICPQRIVECDHCRKDKELECPFAKYKCVGLIKRKDMSKLLGEKRIEHLELKQMEESEIIARQSTMIETMSQEIESLNKKVQHLNNIPIKLEWRITKFPDSKSDLTKRFIIAGYHFEFDFCQNFLEERFQIIIRPLNGWYYDKLKWPFKAEFITRLNSQHNPKETKEFKSEVIVMEKKLFNPYSIISFVIAEISIEDFQRNRCINGVVEFEIYVIFP